MTTPSNDFTVAQNLTVKVPEEVRAHMIPYKRWDALKSQVRDLGERSSSFSSAAWAFVGIAVTAAASLLSWWPAFAAMTPSLQAQFSWVWVVLVALLAVGTGVAIALFLADGKIQTGREASVKAVLAEMEILQDA